MTEELWSVRLPTGVIRRGTLDDLDAAFNAGHIDEDVLVLAPNATTWTKLGDLAGLDEDAAPPPSAAPQLAPPQVAQVAAQVAAQVPPSYAPNSLRPVMMEVAPAPFDLPPPSKAGLIATVVAVGAVAIGGGIFALTSLNTGTGETARRATAAAIAPTQVSSAAAPTTPAVESSAARQTAEARAEAQRQAIALANAKLAKTQSLKKGLEAAAPAAAPRPPTGVDSAKPTKRKSGKPCACTAGDPLCSCF